MNNYDNITAKEALELLALIDKIDKTYETDMKPILLQTAERLADNGKSFNYIHNVLALQGKDTV